MSYIPQFPEASVHKGVFGERQELRTCEGTKNLSHSSISDLEDMWQCHGRRSLCKLQPRCERSGTFSIIQNLMSNYTWGTPESLLR